MSAKNNSKEKEASGGLRSGNKGHDDMPHQIKRKKPKVKKRLRLAGCFFPVCVYVLLMLS